MAVDPYSSFGILLLTVSVFERGRHPLDAAVVTSLPSKHRRSSAGKRFSRLIQSDLQMSGRRIPGLMFVRGLRMDFWGKLGGPEGPPPQNRQHGSRKDV
jgi:hypothetical protein